MGPWNPKVGIQKLSWPLPFSPAIRWPLSCTLACRKYSQPTFETEFVDVLRKILSDADTAVKSAVALLCVVAALLCLVAAAWLLFDVLRKTVAAIPKWVVAVSMVSLISFPAMESIFRNKWIAVSASWVFAAFFCLVGKLAMDAYPELKHEMVKQTIRERRA